MPYSGHNLKKTARELAVKNSAPRIAFIHPELGIGGAERLVIDAALALQSRGARVSIFTARHDTGRCFEETRSGLLDVRVSGRAVPLQVAGRFRAPCAMARMACAALDMGRSAEAWDMIVCDLVPHVMPLVRAVSGGAPLVFYCHFPDLLLAPKRGGPYRLYRYPIDRLEEAGLRAADLILVNSEFTAGVFRETFPRLAGRRVSVLYPGVDTGALVRAMTRPALPGGFRDGDPVILSLNRYDPGKNCELAVAAFAELGKIVPEALFRRLRLIVAGACDERLPESMALLERLRAMAAGLGLADRTAFLTTVSDEERAWLLDRCACLAYTSSREHFGIGIVEAMAAGRPVVAADGGGPRETVRHGETGFLCEPAPAAFARALAQVVTDPELAGRLGRQGRLRAQEHFSLEAFGRELEAITLHVTSGRRHAG